MTVSNSWLRKGTLRRDLILRNASEFERAATLAPFAWPVRHHAAMTSGDIVYLLLQGEGSRGIIASGHVISGDLKTEKHWNKPWDEVTTVDIQWDTTVLPDEVLDTDNLKEKCPQTNWIPRARSTQVRAHDADILATEWAAHVKRLGYLARPGLQRQRGSRDHARTIPDAYAPAAVRTRSHLRAFRWDLLQFYDPRCDFCGLGDVNVLEAVHLVPPSLGGLSKPSNGRLLCANHHRSFTQGILKWDGREFVESAPWLRVPPPIVDRRLGQQVSLALSRALRERGDDQVLRYGFPRPLSLSVFVKLCHQLGLSAPDVLHKALQIRVGEMQ